MLVGLCCVTASEGMVIVLSAVATVVCSRGL